MKSGKRIIASLLAVMSLVLLTSCKTNKEDVKLAGKSELKSYAKKNFGSATLTDFSEEEFKKTARFTDKEYGFEYYVSSSVSEMSIDGSVFGYTETKSTDFNHKYYSCIYAMAEKEFSDRCDIAFGGTSEPGQYMCQVNNVSQEDARKITREIGRFLEKKDTRGYYSKSSSQVKAYSGDKEGYVGSYHIDEDKYYYYPDERIDSMTAVANSDINRAGSEKKEVTFLYWKQMDISEVPGLENWEIVNHTLDDGTLVTLYYFDVAGEKTVFYADIKVWNIGDVCYSDNLTDRRKK